MDLTSNFTFPNFTFFVNMNLVELDVFSTESVLDGLGEMGVLPNTGNGDKPHPGTGRLNEYIIFRALPAVWNHSLS
jgi:hypothetical protein